MMPRLMMTRSSSASWMIAHAFIIRTMISGIPESECTRGRMMFGSHVEHRRGDENVYLDNREKGRIIMDDRNHGEMDHQHVPRQFNGETHERTNVMKGRMDIHPFMELGNAKPTFVQPALGLDDDREEVEPPPGLKQIRFSADRIKTEGGG